MLAQNRFHLPPSFLADTSHTPLNVPRNESESEMDKTCRSIVLLLQWTQAVIASTPAIFIKHGVWVWAVDTISLNIFLPILKSKSFKSEKVLLLPRNKYKYVNYGLVLNFLLSLQPSCILKSLFGSLKLRSPHQDDYRVHQVDVTAWMWRKSKLSQNYIFQLRRIKT